MKNTLIRKSLSLLIITLFITIGFSNNITADLKKTTNKNKELYKYQISIYEPYGKDEYDVYLTKKEKTDLENLLVEIDTKLDNSKSIENSISIYKWAINRFNDLNLLKKHSANEVFNLAVGNVKNRQLTKNVRNEFNNDISNNNVTENKNCLIEGNLNTYYFFDGVPPWLRNLYNFVKRVFGIASVMKDLAYLLCFILGTYYVYIYGEQWDAEIVMGIEGTTYDEWGVWRYFNYPCPVDLWSDGDYGIVEWEGKMWGQLQFIRYDNPQDTYTNVWIGAKGYSGLTIWIGEGWDSFYILGNAYHVALSTEKYPE